ncbi:MAG: hypothetical protein COS76_01790 [Candidatus Portnoybacteria bacterium CG06_land_8_20_14_3_00_39_12]|uniref:PAS domain-containing protein n=2 Tax=Candidatus Portnoyibacteriota TaxID=1817913 RepID=A0A2M7UJF8_9BACT|nr:MAG: hypothetical protein AUJ33_02890 [Parcubacteria group bacterium CG1_02_40_25]PIU75257.1 MAG: hypothetical protein COS76_01790 [Candidatus Portnoybacteria bacterium CG06_land_8_20_14_3_00_39_12]PIZ71365.1 MAG: hypothetical protein COY09_00920 [Candidatus Portnoybacteria bacterium CG_4_10_14_0_2_um_filter_39_11]
MAVVVVDKNGNITRVNKGFEVLTDWKKEEVIGGSLVKIIPKEDENRNIIPFKERILPKVLSGVVLTTIEFTFQNRT